MNLSRDNDELSSLTRGLTVLECFDASRPEMTLSEVARRTDLTPATARRCLRTLRNLGYVRELHRKFTLAPRVLTLGSAYLRSAQVDDALLPELRQIVTAFGDAASVGVLLGHDVLCIAHVSAERNPWPMAGSGVSYPAYATSLGRVLLSNHPRQDIEQYLAAAEPTKHTDCTEVDSAKLLDAVIAARSDGYAAERDQLAYGVTSMAVPISMRPGHVIAAVSTSGYTIRTSPEALVRERLHELRVAAGRIAETLLRFPALCHSLGYDGTVLSAASRTQTIAHEIPTRIAARYTRKSPNIAINPS